MTNEILPFLPIADIASIVDEYLQPLTPNSMGVKKFRPRLQGAIKRILLRGIDKTVIKNNKLKIKIEICKNGNILLNITSKYHAVFLGEILTMADTGDIFYMGDIENVKVGSIYDKDIRKITKYMKNNINCILYFLHVSKVIELKMH